MRLTYLVLCGLCLAGSVQALNPRKRLTQFTRSVWTQEHGLPQDTIRAIAQTTEGYLWLATEEGLARFDGYEFAVFTKDKADLPSNSILSLCAGRDGALWIGTAEGLACYRHRQFTTYGAKEGLSDKVVNSVAEAKDGTIWTASGVSLTSFRDGKFYRHSPAIQAARVVYEDKDGVLWVSGFGGVARLVNGKFETVIGADAMSGNMITSMLKDNAGNLWIAGNKGILRRWPDGSLKHYTERDGLPDRLVRAIRQDRSGSIWAGTNGGLSRLEGKRFVSLHSGSSRDEDWVRSIFEDREGNLWVGMNSGLNRFREDLFTVFTKAEGMPSDEPTAVYQDKSGNVWVGFHNGGLVRFREGSHRAYNTRDGLVSNEIFSIREGRRGDLLIGTREGLSRFDEGRFRNYRIKDELARNSVYDALEDSQGRVWAATPSGLFLLTGAAPEKVIPGGPLLNNSVVVLCDDGQGGIWAGTYGTGLWHYKDGSKRLFTSADGLSNDRVRSLWRDGDGTLWIGTFGGGLNRFASNRFTAYRSINGLPSDNISHIEDDRRGSLWLSTTRGICRLAKSQLKAFDSGKAKTLTPVNYGIKDGLRSAQCAPGSPTGGGGEATSDGRLWFPTSHGLAVLSLDDREPEPPAPAVQLTDAIADRVPLNLSGPSEFGPTSGRIQFRYTGIHLRSPERVQYAYRLEGLDRDWIPAGTRRTANYNSLWPGQYRFVVKASVPGGAVSETSFAFRLRPHFYQTVWFLVLCGLGAMGLVWVAYQLRLRQIRSRFAAVLEERARLAREIHDTLAQGFVGISSQLEATSVAMDQDTNTARRHLDLARKMARHSLTEARRSVTDLRASALEGQDLAAALSKAAPMWAAGSSLKVEVEVVGLPAKLPEPVEQHLLRIAQEAVTNAVKHSKAHNVCVRLLTKAPNVHLSIQDDGCGFDPKNTFMSAEGHFGMMGMRERAQRAGGKLNLYSAPGQGTRIEVTVPAS